MANQPKLPHYVATLALLNRQLADWQNLLAQLQESDAPAEQCEYARRQIERFKADLKAFDN
ncbi:hypothetical protein [Spirosoma sordidisoli]|uniref:Uncharacterized protein n=1 Tax=Spirosoma sordidisoli TaxID=2502893 RepID=A0A4Q2UVB2_9BACT|nr:hypothetical protein [Spirosoma sordidisoli]RYC70869.1 hypothetical protein EQG79_01575 [Spirosoma sordidisoli]